MTYRERSEGQIKQTAAKWERNNDTSEGIGPPPEHGGAAATGEENPPEKKGFGSA